MRARRLCNSTAGRALAPAVVVSDNPIRIPIATYRLQFNGSFRFRDAEPVLTYLARLGVSDIYASSYLEAVPGSTHGYDVVDPTRLNPEIGTEADYWQFVERLHAAGLGQLLDVVPNHMGIARSANRWWMDVLANGPASRYASFFDITWKPLKDELADKVLIPTLGDQYGAVLDRLELQLVLAGDEFRVRYFDAWFPIAVDTWDLILEPAFEEWTSTSTPASADSDELRSIMTAATRLPPRTAPSSVDQREERAREGAVVKRRLAALLARCTDLGVALDRTLSRINGTPGQPASVDHLDALLARQSYRLAHWRTASEEINYRRFFDVNELAALRVEEPEVFDTVHQLVFDLIARGAATGLRIDHVDGLFDPADYLRRIQARAAAALATRAPAPLYVVVEKILGVDEPLPRNWPVHGTTGYDFSAVMNALCIDSSQAPALDRTYRRFVDGALARVGFDDLAYACKKRVMHETMSGDINSLGYHLNRFSERNRHFRDFTLYSLIATIKEVIACFPVYRTYITAGTPVSERDRHYVSQAIAGARRASPGLAGLVFDFVEHILLHDDRLVGSIADRDERQRFVGTLQQVTSPVAAKGIEDTALYVYNRLLSVNEVGDDPRGLGTSPERVHEWMRQRQEQWPHALSGGATHDTKRGEDARARISAISELAPEWARAVRRWRTLARRLKPAVGGRLAPDPNEEYGLYQALVGAWPFDPREPGGLATTAPPPFVARLTRYAVKALREAKVNSSWLAPNESYERAVCDWLERVLDPSRGFLRAFLPFAQRVAELGMVNSLSQLVVRCAAPGVPDFYQGTELWDLSFVDPDNRAPVDYPARAAGLDEVIDLPDDAATVRHLIDRRHDGTLKLFTIQRALRARRAEIDLFRNGRYLPIGVVGAQAVRTYAFARVANERAAIVCVPRLSAGLPGGRTPPLGREAWGDTSMLIPADIDARPLRHAFTGRQVGLRTMADGTRRIEVAEVLAEFPVGLMIPSTSSSV